MIAPEETRENAWVSTLGVLGDQDIEFGYGDAGASDNGFSLLGRENSVSQRSEKLSRSPCLSRLLATAQES